VSFDSLGGSAVEAQTVAHGDRAAEPSPAPLKEGCVFEGWHREAACVTRWDFAADTVSADMTLYARWGAPVGERMTIAPGGVNVAFRYVPAGQFQRDVIATNTSIISRGYWMSETEVTQELFQAVMGVNPSGFDGSEGNEPAPGETQERRPVEQVSWYDAIAFCNKLSLADGKEPVYRVRVGGTSAQVDWAGLAYSSIPTWRNDDWDSVVMDRSKNGYRLPTEMEWIWAAIGADAQPDTDTTWWYAKTFAGSNGSNILDDYAWHGNNSGGRTHETGKKLPNELGLYDMTGNVMEWCWDWYDSYPVWEQTDYAGPASKPSTSPSSRVIRGGHYLNKADSCEIAVRDHRVPVGGGTYGVPVAKTSATGFRIVCP
jgi:formylglycine-generating enzyme required for sulfatase activity